MTEVIPAPPRRRSTDHVQNVGPLRWLTPRRLGLLAYAGVAALAIAVMVHEHMSGIAIGVVAATSLWIPLTLSVHRRVAREQYERERLLQRLVTVSDLERRRVAAEVHDGALQDLIGLSFSLQTIAEQVPAPADEQLRDAAELTRGLMTRMRSLLQSMYPIEVPPTGWIDGILDLVKPLRASGVDVAIDVPRTQWSPLNEVVALRVTREALRNVAAHAQATQVRVVADQDEQRIVLSIIDNGTGFDQEMRDQREREGHFGMRLLHDLACEAGAALEVASAPGRGTTVTLEMRERRDPRAHR